MKDVSIISGNGIGKGKGVGTVIIVDGMKDFHKIKGGEVVVSKYATPDYILILKKIACLVTDAGGVTSHIAIVCREIGGQAIIGTGDATNLLNNGSVVSFDVEMGEIRVVSL